MEPSLAAPLLAALPSFPVALLDFWDDFGIVVLVLVFFALYKYMAGFIQNAFLALLVTVTIVVLVVLPYDWMKYLLFVVVVMFGFWSNLKPWEWGK